MPHSIPVNKPKESDVVNDAIVKEIMEKMFWIIGLNTCKDLTYIHTGTNH